MLAQIWNIWPGDGHFLGLMIVLIDLNRRGGVFKTIWSYYIEKVLICDFRRVDIIFCCHKDTVILRTNILKTLDFVILKTLDTHTQTHTQTQVLHELSINPDMMWNTHGNKWVCWGIMPQLFGMVGYFGTMLCLEAALSTDALKSSLLRYGPKTREECIRETQKKNSKWIQLRTSLWNIMGPSAVLSTVMLVLIMDWWMPKVSDRDPASWAGLIDFAVCFVLADFFLYWGHRIQHMNEWLWTHLHSLHHELDTPTPIGTGYVHSIDAKIQTETPLILAALIWKPHPFVWYLVIACKIAESVVLHSGSASVLLSILTLRFLPFRAEVRHHDCHHKYSNYSRNSKNFGEAFWIWDWMFGTLSTYRKQNWHASIIIMAHIFASVLCKRQHRNRELILLCVINEMIESV